MAAQRLHTEKQTPPQAATLSIRGLDLMSWLRGGDTESWDRRWPYNAGDSPVIGRDGKAQQLNPVPSHLETTPDSLTSCLPRI